MNLRGLTVDKLRALYRSRELSVVEAVGGVYEDIERLDGRIHAFIALDRDRAMEAARRTDGKIAAGGPLEPFD
jgi:aspartyl-tRNA(Asn)/glutamyl-tRNA(Gln) amidotransferase subunit A